MRKLISELAPSLTHNCKSIDLTFHGTGHFMHFQENGYIFWKIKVHQRFWYTVRKSISELAPSLTHNCKSIDLTFHGTGHFMHFQENGYIFWKIKVHQRFWYTVRKLISELAPSLTHNCKSIDLTFHGTGHFMHPGLSWVVVLQKFIIIR